MDHLQAESLGATEKYLLGALDEAEREAFEEHFFDCLECADDVRAAAAVLAAAGATAALTAVPAAPAMLPTPRSSPVTDIGQRRRRFARVSRVTAAVGTLAAAAMCMVVYQRAVVIPDLRDQVAESQSIQAVRGHFLTQTRSEAPRISVTDADRMIALTLSRSWDKQFPSYRCELQDASGHLLLAETLADHSTTDELEILVPVKGLAAGAYVLTVEGLDAPRPGSGPPPTSAAPVARYSFQLERR